MNETLGYLNHTFSVYKVIKLIIYNRKKNVKKISDKWENQKCWTWESSIVTLNSFRNRFKVRGIVDGVLQTTKIIIKSNLK